MEAEQAILDLLFAASDVTDLVSNRIYFTLGPQTPVLPFVTITRISTSTVYSLTGASGLATARIQVDIFAQTASQCRAIGAAVKATIGGKRVTNGGVSLQSILQIDSQDNYNAPTEIKQVSQDYAVCYQE